jgi:hypothetical protein
VVNEEIVVSMTGAFAGSVLVLTIALATATAFSAEPPPPDQHAGTVDELYRAGVDAMNRKDWLNAYTALSSAWQLEQSSDIAGLLGQTERNLGRCASAIPHLEKALENPPVAEEDRGRAIEQLKLLLRDCRDRVDQVTVSAPPGTEVHVDGASVGTAPVPNPIFLDRGTHVLEAHRGSVVLAKTSIDVHGGKAYPVALEEAVPSSPTREPERFHEPSPVKQPGLVPAYLLGGITLLAGGATIVFYAAAKNTKSELEGRIAGADRSLCVGNDAPPGCASLPPLQTKYDRYATAVDVGAIVTGIAALATVGYVSYVLVRRQKPPTVGFNASGAGGRLILSGAF